MPSATKQIINANKLSLPFTNVSRNISSSNTVINLDRGDPTMFQPYWEKMGDKCSIEISGTQGMSYFSSCKNVCWFMEPEFAEAVKRLHEVVGNAVTEDRHIVVGTGSTQLTHAVLYALSTPAGSEPTSVVCAAPYYSSYPEETDFLHSGLYKWAGDAHKFNKDGPYIEFVTCPNNPDGTIREAVVKQGKGKLVHDLAYYWPQYTPITAAADHDIMLFTFSKCTGHAGSRIGWAIVKDKEVARKMTQFIMLSTIGVSKESQLRAAKIINVLCDGCQSFNSIEKENFFAFGQRILTERWGKLRDIIRRSSKESPLRAAKIINALCDGCQSFGSIDDKENFFAFGQRILTERWGKLRDVIRHSDILSLPQYPKEYCLFTKEYTETSPAFAWLKCNYDIEDGHKFLAAHDVLTRGGKNFGADAKYVRISMLGRDEEFNMFLERILMIQSVANGKHI